MVAHCELYLCNINRLDIPEEVNLIWISQSTEYLYVFIVKIGSTGVEPMTYLK